MNLEKIYKYWKKFWPILIVLWTLIFIFITIYYFIYYSSIVFNSPFLILIITILIILPLAIIRMCYEPRLIFFLERNSERKRGRKRKRRIKNLFKIDPTGLSHFNYFYDYLIDFDYM